MRPSKFSETQIVGILREAEAGVPVTDVIRKDGISRTTYFTWKAKYVNATVQELARLRKLEQANARLKRMYADLALENGASRTSSVASCSADREAAGRRGPGRGARAIGRARLADRRPLAGGVLRAAA